MIRRIVVTGAASSGKSTVVGMMEKLLEAENIRTIIVPETATGLLRMGLDAKDSYNFQKMVLKQQLINEEIAELLVKENPDERDTVILCDRGVADGMYYLDRRFSFEEMLGEVGLTVSDIEARYDREILLAPFVKSAADLQNNNEYRQETSVEEIAAQERAFRVIYPNAAVIGATSTMGEKAELVKEEVLKTLHR